MINGRDQDYSRDMVLDFGPSRHFTFIFNTFVMMQIFNFLNARMLKDEFWVLSGKYPNARHLK